MKIILLQNIPGLGKKYDVKEAAPGYARNCLLPKKLAEIATDERLAKLEKEKKIHEAEHEKLLAKLQEYVKKIAKLRFVFKLKTGAKGEAFGAVSDRDIEKFIEANGISGAKVSLPHHLKTIGEHDVDVYLGEGVKTTVTVLVESEVE